MKSKSLMCLKADVYRYEKSYHWRKIIKNALFNTTFRPIFTLRMCQHFAEKNTVLSRALLLIFKILHRCACKKNGVLLRWRTKIGPGFALIHGWGTVISSKAVIGSNVTVFHGVTIGTKHKMLENGERIAGFPVIKNDVWIGTNSVIIGEVSIGEGSKIAPLSMVINNVDAHTTIGCNPQRILSENSTEDVYNKVSMEYIEKHCI